MIISSFSTICAYYEFVITVDHSYSKKALAISILNESDPLRNNSDRVNQSKDCGIPGYGNMFMKQEKFRQFTPNDHFRDHFWSAIYPIKILIWANTISVLGKFPKDRINKLREGCPARYPTTTARKFSFAYLPKG
ncbi:MAG: hypothetical protein EA409_10050 [Saprospirales bacterium]|nr:MAG: hypothetical protein EA409_10050 [Saprospirales bacterium]